MRDRDRDLKAESSHLVTTIESKHIRLFQDHDNSSVVYVTRHLANKAGFKVTDSTMIATAASELATNIIRYAGDGYITVAIVKSPTTGLIGIELLADDNGPGIQDLERAMQERFSSQPHSLGLGLPSVKRIMDEFAIESIPGKGTRVLARKWKPYG